MKTYLNSLIILLLMLTGLTVNAQFYSPGLQAPDVDPCPLTFPGGTGVTSVNLINADLLPLNNPVTGVADPTVIVISLQLIAPQGLSTSAISGAGASYFSWVYNASLNSFQGTQIQDIPAFISDPIIIAFDVTAPSTIATPLNGFSASLTPPNYSTGTNVTDDDAQSSYCYTEELVTCDADNGTLSFGN